MRKMRLIKLNKKGIIDNFLPLVTALVGVGISLVIGFLILAQVAANTTVAADPNSTAAVKLVQSSMGQIPGWLPIIIVAVIGSLLLALVQYFRK